jgi:7-cyano-7-deazaguanine synthase
MNGDLIEMNNAIVLCSGGFDSVITAYYVKKQNPEKLIILFFDYGQRPIKEEMFCAKKTAEDLDAEFKVIKLPWLGELSTSIINKEKEFKETTDSDLKDVKKSKEDIINWWVPTRNTVFLTVALALAESLFLRTKEKYDIYIGFKSEGQVYFKDTTPEFLKKMNELVEHATDDGNYKILAPFIDKDKDELSSVGKELNVPFEYTYSCYIGNGFKNSIPVHCGKCLNCVLRKKAFYWANISDPSIYS